MDQATIEEWFVDARAHADELVAGGDLEGAIARLQSRFEEAGEPEDLTLQGYFWRAVTMVYGAAEKIELAYEASLRSVEAYQTAGLAQEVAKSQVGQVYILGFLNRIDDAEQLAAQLMPLFNENPFGQLMIKENLAFGYGMSGQLEKMNQTSEEVIDLCLEHGLYQDVLTSLMGVGINLELMGQLEESLAVYQDRIPSVLAEIDEAELDSLVDARQKINLNAAILLIKLGRFEAGLERLESLRQTFTLTTPSMRGYSAMTEGTVRGLLGDRELGGHYLRQALAAFEHPLDQIEAQLHLSQLLRSPLVQHYEEGLSLSKRSLKQLERTPHGPLRRQILIELAEIYLALQRYREAEETIQRGVLNESEETQLTWPIQYRLSQLILAEALMQSDPESALSLHQTVLQDHALPMTLELRGLTGVGESLLRLERYAAAQTAFSEMLSQLERWRRDLAGHTRQAGLLERAARPLSGLLQACVASGEDGQVILDHIEAVNGQSLAEFALRAQATRDDDQLRPLFLRREEIMRQLDLILQPLMINRPDGDPSEALSATLDNQQAVTLKGELDRLEGEIGRLIAANAKREVALPPIADLPPTVGFVTWFVAGETLYVVCRVGMTINYFPLEHGLDEIHTAWKQLFRQMSRRRLKGSIQRRTVDLFENLFGPIKADLEQVDRLLLVPIGPLWQIPFASLLEPVSGQPLGAGWEITVTPSLSLWHLCQSRKPSGDGVLLAGYSGTPESLPYLPAVRKEIARLEERFPNGVVLSDADMTREKVGPALTQQRLIHLAGHIEYDLERPILSGIRLYGGRYYRAADFYLAPSSLAGAHVVLSGCDSGRVLQVGGEVVGLLSSLIAAGASSLLVSLWPVDDDATATFMDHYYTALETAATPAAALQAAQQKMRDAHPHPIDWASFAAILK